MEAVRRDDSLIQTVTSDEVCALRDIADVRYPSHGRHNFQRPLASFCPTIMLNEPEVFQESDPNSLVPRKQADSGGEWKTVDGVIYQGIVLASDATPDPGMSGETNETLPDGCSVLADGSLQR